MSAKLGAKFLAPQLAVTLPRPRLFQWLDEQAGVTLTWISAAPGMGKTTLLASYLKERKLPFVWYRCDAGDVALTQIYPNLTQACTTSLNLKHELPNYTHDMWPSPALFAEAFFTALYENQTEPFVLIFDNIEQNNIDAIEAVIFAAANAASPGMRIIAGARPMPDGYCLALAARQKLSILTDAALGFNEQESRALAARVGVGSDFLVGAAARLKGWAAGITLAYTFERLRVNDPFSAGAPTEAAARLAFFVCGIYDAQPHATQLVLMATFMLPEIDAGTACALAGDDEAMLRLAELHQANLFVELVQAVPTLYRYHPAFAEFLRDHAMVSLGKVGVRLAYENASAHALANGEIEVALGYLLTTQDWLQAIHLLETLADNMIAVGRIDQLHRWLSDIPAPLLAEHPMLLYQFGLVGTWCEDHRAVDKLVMAGDIFAQRRNTAMLLKSAAAIMDFAYNEWADFNAYDRWVDYLATVNNALLESLPPHDAVAIAGGVASAALVSARSLPYAEAIMSREQPWLESASPSVRVHASVQVLEFVSNRRDWPRAAVIVTQINGLLANVQIPVALRTRALARRSYYFDYRRGDYDQATHFAREALALARKHRLPFSEREAVITLSLVALMQGEIDEAQRAIADELACVLPVHLAARANVHYERAWWYALQDNIVDAEREHALATALFSSSGEAGVMSLATPMQESQFHALRGEYIDAIQLMSSGAGAESAMWRTQRALLTALSALNVGDEQAALGYLAEGLAIARTHELAGTLWAMRAAYSKLLAMALEHRIEVPWVHRIIATRRLAPPDASAQHWPWQLRISAIGPLGFYRRDGSKITKGRPRKPLELLCLILSLPNDIEISQLGTQLWPSADAASVRRNLDTTLHRLRAWLDSPDLLVVSNGCVNLDRRRVWVDLDALDQLEQEITQKLAQGSLPPTHQSAEPWRQLASRLIALHRGRLCNDVFANSPWMTRAATRIQTKIEAIVIAIGASLEAHGEWQCAITLYGHAFAHDGTNELFLRGRLRCLVAIGEHSVACKVFREADAELKRILGVHASVETRALIGL